MTILLPEEVVAAKGRHVNSGFERQTDDRIFYPCFALISFDYSGGGKAGEIGGLLGRKGFCPQIDTDSMLNWL